jgi:hypothetical protein
MEPMRLNTIGMMSQRLQRAPGAIEATLKRLEIEPVLTAQRARLLRRGGREHSRPPRRT